MVLLRLHLQLSAPFLSVLSRLAYITLTGSGEVTLSGVKNKRLGGWKHDNVPCVLNTVKALDVEPDAHCRPVLCLKIITRVNCFTSFMFYVSLHLFQCNLLHLFLTLNIQLFCLKFKNQPKIFPGNFYELSLFF